MDQPFKRQLPQEYVQKISELDSVKEPPVPQILNQVMERISARNNAFLKEFERAIGPVEDFQGTIERI
jgi:hypothetical protein